MFNHERCDAPHKECNVRVSPKREDNRDIMSKKRSLAHSLFPSHTFSPQHIFPVLIHAFFLLLFTFSYPSSLFKHPRSPYSETAIMLGLLLFLNSSPRLLVFLRTSTAPSHPPQTHSHPAPTALSLHYLHFSLYNTLTHTRPFLSTPLFQHASFLYCSNTPFRTNIWCHDTSAWPCARDCSGRCCSQTRGSWLPSLSVLTTQIMFND